MRKKECVILKRLIDGTQSQISKCMKQELAELESKLLHKSPKTEFRRGTEPEPEMRSEGGYVTLRSCVMIAE